jgi:hypothetical protein
MDEESIRVRNPLAIRLATRAVKLGVARTLAEAISDHAIISLRETLREERAPRRSKSAEAVAGHAGE